MEKNGIKMIKIRVEFMEINEVDKLIETLESNYEIVDISKEYKNRPPSKLSRIYISLEELNK